MSAVRQWAHDELQADLARSRTGEVVVEKLSLGMWGGAGQMDVWSARLSRTQPRPTCWEVKVSRGDFLADVRAEKFRRYEPWAERCYFAVPAGMVSREEVPAGWGLVARGPKGWYGLRAPQRRRLEEEAWRPLMMAVMLALHPGPWQEPRRVERVTSIVDHQAAGRDLRRARYATRTFGKQVQAIMADAEKARDEAAGERSAVRAAARALGVETEDCHHWEVHNRLHARLRELQAQHRGARIPLPTHGPGDPP